MDYSDSLSSSIPVILDKSSRFGLVSLFNVHQSLWVVQCQSHPCKRITVIFFNLLLHSHLDGTQSEIHWWIICMYIYIYHHHHHGMPLARISQTLSRHFSLSFITSGRSSGLHPVSSHSCWMYVRAGRPAFAWPYVGVHRSSSLMSSSLLLQ